MITNSLGLQARSFANLDDVHVFGLAIYTGLNPQAKLLSSFWSGSDAADILMKINKVNYGQLIEYAQSSIQCVHVVY